MSSKKQNETLTKIKIIQFWEDKPDLQVDDNPVKDISEGHETAGQGNF